MRCLLHCIFQDDRSEVLEACGPEVVVVHGHGLAAATSPWRDGEPPLGVAGLLAYGKVIAGLHATRTVVPLRFGCVVEGPSRVRQLLDEREPEFRQLLCRLEGLAEMGLRIWGESPQEDPIPRDPGARYLAAARRRHAGLTPVEQRWTRQLCRPLEGFYVQEKREARPGPEGRLVSMHFLVARAAVEDFRERMRRLALPEKMKLLVSGPWPPYNFVDHA